MELLWQLLAVCVIGFFWAGCPCCGASPVCTATNCTNGGPLGAPTQYQVDVSGFVDGNCASSSCSNLHGSYSFTIPVACVAELSATPPTKVWQGPNCGGIGDPSVCNTPADAASIELSFNLNLIQVAIIVDYSAGGLTNSYTYRHTGSVDCSSLSGTSLTFFTQRWAKPSCSTTTSGSGAACDGSGAAVTVTTV